MIFAFRFKIVLIIFMCVTYFIFYKLIEFSNIFTVQNLLYVKNISIFILIIFTALLFDIRRIRNFNIWALLYRLLGSFLVCFAIMSIFVFKVQDLFFWNENRDDNNIFFNFSYCIQGVNNLMFIIYILFLLCEVLIIFNKKN